MSVATILIVSRCQVSRFQLPLTSRLIGHFVITMLNQPISESPSLTASLHDLYKNLNCQNCAVSRMTNTFIFNFETSANVVGFAGLAYWIVNQCSKWSYMAR